MVNYFLQESTTSYVVSHSCRHQWEMVAGLLCVGLDYSVPGCSQNTNLPTLDGAGGKWTLEPIEHKKES